jgi:catechol 2,3-dioxygenase
MSDHMVSESLYLRDPDGNEVDLYVDADESVWNNTAAAVLAGIKPLHVSSTKEDCSWRNHALQPSSRQ